jgi:hypothetical protein
MATQYTAGLSAGQVLTAATMNSIGAEWETWTPVLTASITNPTLGTGGSTGGRYARINKTVFGNAFIVFGTAGTNAGNGFYFCSLPIAAQSNTWPMGGGWILDSSASLERHIEITPDTVNRVGLWIDNSTNFALSNGNPWPWGASDQIRFSFCYEAA